MQNYDKILLQLLKNNADPVLHQLFDMLPVGIELYNKQGVLVATNQYNVDLYGLYDKAQLFGLNLFYDKSVTPEFQALLGEEEELSLWHYYDFARTPNSKKTGRMRVFSSFKKFRNKKGDITGYAVINMEDSAYQSNFSNDIGPAVVENYGSMRAHAIYNGDGKLLHVIMSNVTKCIATLLGKRLEELEGKDFLHSALYVPYLEEIGKLNDENKKLTFYYYAISTRRYIKWTVSYQGNNEYFCRLTDITDHLMDNQAVNFSEDLFRSCYDNSPQATIFVDRQGYVEDVNQCFLDLMGLEHKSEILGYRISRDINIEEKSRFNIKRNQSFEFEQIFRIDRSLFKSKLDDTIYIRVHTNRFYLPNGQMRGYIVYITNLTKEKEEQDMLEIKTQKAIEASNMKSRFIQNMSHDIRTPLNAIVGFSQLLGLPDGSLTPEEKEEYTNHITNSSNMLMMLVDDILNISDVEQGNYRITVRPVNVHELLNNTLKSVEYRVPVDVRCYYTTDVDNNAVIRTDGRRVQQVLINFLTNACKHTTQGEIQLRCLLNEVPGKVHFSVIDTGSGVDEELADNLFERFMKLSTVEGTGLGLNICSTISQRLGGSVSYDKEYKGGAKFDFILPRDIS